ncbi:MAG TPA: Glu-tRNA(Gln) amidotransferase subunit GatD [bacterium]
MSNNGDFKGYREPVVSILQKNNVRVWSDVELESKRGTFKGIILPRSETSDEFHIVLKLHSGYNVGIHANNITSIKELGYKEAKYAIPEKEFPTKPENKNVILLGTGGTIASRLDYRTGAVIPAFSPGELYGAVPELADIANLTTEKIYGIFSENMEKNAYIALAKRIGKAIEEGYDGVVIGHGTDTMHHTGAILSYMVQNPPVPIVLVGSQRSSDRPSSDAATNLINATRTAADCDIAEVMVCMFGPTSDWYGLLHRGTRVRKMHSSYRSTFRTIGDTPLAMVSPEGFTHLKEKFNRRRKDRDVTVIPTYDDRVTILYYYPGMRPDIVDSAVEKGYRGIIIAGTGLGHVNQPLYDPIQIACEKGMHVFMTVQTLWGYVHMDVYETGRDLQKRGIVPCANMTPEAAYMKLCWVLGQVDEGEDVKPEGRKKVREMMLKPIAGETTSREPYNGNIILQGGIPEVDDFFGTTLKYL